jgi:rhodanese-related sulfurtransferase
MAKNLERDEAARMLQSPQTFVLDVRTPAENQRDALDRSTLIPIDQLERRIEELPPNRETPILIYCAHGIRSVFGASILERHGFKNIFNLAGGIVAYRQSKH